MRYAIWLMTATCLTAAAVQAPLLAQAPAPMPTGPAFPSAGYSGGTYGQSTGQPQMVPQGTTYNNGVTMYGDGNMAEYPSQGTHGRSFWQRLGGLFHSSHSSSPYGNSAGMQWQPVPNGKPMPTSTPYTPESPEPPRLTPIPSSPAGPGGVSRLGSGSVQRVAMKSVEGVTESGAGGQGGLKNLAMADDGTWLIGRLAYVHADGGIWLVRYAGLDQEDRNGGAVALAPGVGMMGLHEGDLVFVRGKMLKQGRGSSHVGAPLYLASSVELNEMPHE